MIVMKNICKAYGNLSVLENFSLTIEDGSFISITGHSGSGKTTLLNIMGLLERPDSGTIEIDENQVLSSRARLLFYRNNAGFLFQNYALVEEKTVFGNLKIALAFNKSKTQYAMQSVLEMVGLPREIGKKRIYQLSGGEQQRLALARILLKNPKYIFADEPTGNLDLDNRNIVFDHLKTLNEQGKTVIIVTHDATLASQTQQSIAL